MEKKFLGVTEVAAYMGISIPTAYKIIRTLNLELKSEGYITVAGRVNRDYFEEKANGPRKMAG